MTTKHPTASTASASSAGGKKRKLVNVFLLNGDQQVFYVDVKSKFQEIFNQVVSFLSLREIEYFGLALKNGNEYNFLALDEKIHKLAPKQWKTSSGEGTDAQGKPLLSVWFRVQFYVDNVILLREKVTRHQYYLQLKENVLNYNHLYNEDKCFQLAAYGLQADFGNYVHETHQRGYFNPALYFPTWMLERHGTDYLAENVPTIHKDLHGITRNGAELRYIRAASTVPGAHNLHFYSVRQRKTDKACNTWLAVCARGVEVYEDDAGYKNHISIFLWKDIGKLYFDKRKFEIRSVQSVGGKRYVYYTDTDLKSKYLLSICRTTHLFQMAIQPKLEELQYLDNEDQKRYRESYTYSDIRDKSLAYQSSGTKSSLVCMSAGTNQRNSVISDVSSNTTSGIVSDKMAVSFDDGDDHREIMIDCPPSTRIPLTPSQPRSKFHMLSGLSGFKASPQSQKTSPVGVPHSLSLRKVDSSQDFSPTISNSWRSKRLPSPTTPTKDGKYVTGFRGSLGRKESFGQKTPRQRCSGIERSTSGDSAVSMSGILTSEKLAPLSLPHPEYDSGSSLSGKLCRGSSSSSNYSLTPPLTLGNIHKSSIPSPSNSFQQAADLPPRSKEKTSDDPMKPITPQKQNFLSSNKEPVDQSQIVLNPGRMSAPPYSLNETFKGISQHRLGTFVVNSDINEKDQENLVDFNTGYYPSAQQLNLQASSLQTPNQIYSDRLLSEVSSSYTRGNDPIVAQNLNRSDQVIYSNQQLLQLQDCPQPPIMPPPPYSHNPNKVKITEHYLLALQKPPSQLIVDKGSDSKPGGVHVLNPQSPPQIDTSHTLQHPQDQIGKLDQPSATTSNSSQVKRSDELQQFSSTNMINNLLLNQAQSAKQQLEENKENVYVTNVTELKTSNEEEKSDIGAMSKRHGKGNLHPELKHILGQSHAISLPLITALCNDSSLMQSSRSQSGSRSSYDTSTIRSTDSRLTRYSHETDPRRWSSCIQSSGLPEMLLSVNSARPYSWHSEHFDLDAQLALPLSNNDLSNHANRSNKIIDKLIQNDQFSQKMIESDPGPSSPRVTSAMNQRVAWWDVPVNSLHTDRTSNSLVSVSQSHSIRSSGLIHSNVQHTRVPTRLSSGGHRDSDSSISHKQMLTENVGIA